MIKALSVTILLFVANIAFAEKHLRYNQFGYAPDRPKTLILMSDKELQGTQWWLENEAGAIIFEGALTNSLAGLSDHTSHAFNYGVALPSVLDVGLYTFKIGDDRFGPIRVKLSNYESLIADMLQHLKVARSGTSDTLLHPASHLGDAKAILYKMDGSPEAGKWKKDERDLTVDMLGGWYDAGDYIKFTLTIAYTTYYLLRAYEANEDLFASGDGEGQWPQILAEAKIGLDYLTKTMPDNNTFVVQVSTSLDHVGWRLPQNDVRDGQREALAAISPAHMGMTSAALALGAKLFQKLGGADIAQVYETKAINIYRRARQPDALAIAAYEKGPTNDFYRDNNQADNMGLAAVELFLSTGDPSFKQQADAYSEQAGVVGWVSWCCVSLSLNYRLSDEALFATAFSDEMQGFKSYSQSPGNIWDIPMQPTWAPLLGQNVVTAYAGLAMLDNQKAYENMFWHNIDYFFGKNNWGATFIANESIQGAVKNVYSQIYTLLGAFPTGAVAEGPGSRSTYESLSAYFRDDASDRDFDHFNTRAQIFYDNASNFQTMESTITIQAASIFMLSVAAKVEDLRPQNKKSNSSGSSSSGNSNNVSSSNSSSHGELPNQSASGVSFSFLLIILLLIPNFFNGYCRR